METAIKRTLAYEISGYRDRHWVIDSIVEDEEAAIARGHALLHANRFDEVKIVRQRTAPSGFTMESEIFHDSASNVRPITLAGDPEDVPLCQDGDALFGLDARLAIGRLLRRYLDRESFTATELMHVWPYLRRLDDQTGHLVAAAVHKVGTAQAKILGIPTMQRVQLLHRWMAGWMSRVRDFGAERRRVKFDPEDFDRSVRRLEIQFEDARERCFVLTSSICYHMMGLGSLAGRLEWLLEALGRSAHPELSQVFEEMIADALSSSAVVGEMLVSLPSRAAVIARIADLVTGRFTPPPGERIDPIFMAVARVHGERGLKAAAEVLTGWLVREVARAQPMDARNPAADEELFRALLPRLRDRDGNLLGGAKMQQSVATYRLGQRQRVLRGMGMDDQANELAKIWSVAMVEQMAPLTATPAG